jgi:hypothetical protein
MNARQWIAMVMAMVCVFAMGIGVYDRLVRAPRSVRLGVVDVGSVYAVLQKGALTPQAGNAPEDIGKASNALAARMEDILKAFSHECDCLLLSSPAVYGSQDAIPDYTATIIRRIEHPGSGR